MSEKKSITIDTNMLLGANSMNKSKRKSSRSSGGGERKIRPNSIVQPSTLKKTLLERIKQHQRTRERSRDQRHDDHEHDDSNKISSSTGSSNTVETSNDNFTQSIDFLRKLAMKRRQQMTQKRAVSGSGSFGRSNSSSNGIGGLPEAKTPEAKMLNQVAETLRNGEILTNTGLLGLPVVNTTIQPQSHSQLHSSSSATVFDINNNVTPMISLGPMPMPVPAAPINTPMSFSNPMFDTVSSSFPSSPASAPSPVPVPISEPPKLTQLAEMYNNTVAAVSELPVSTETKEDTPLHIPTKPEDYLPSIFIKEEPPHGCLKNGKKPTFREWATNILKKPVDTVKNMMGGGGGPDDDGATNGQIGGGEGGEMRENQENNNLSNSVSNIDPEQIAGMRVKIRKTHKKRFRIGKHDNVVGVLLKNKQTQRHIQSQHLTLKQKTIGEIRKYLYDHHLLKIGSNAPPDVLRRMYEDAILTGDVKNTNKDVLLHNFMSGGGDHE